eukprot:gene27883-57002_t
MPTTTEKGVRIFEPSKGGRAGGDEAAAALDADPGIQRVDCFKKELGQNGALTLLTAVERHKKVQEVSLRGCALTDAAVRRAGQVAGDCPNITRMWLGSNKGISAAAWSDAHASLLRNTAITDVYLN